VGCWCCRLGAPAIRMTLICTALARGADAAALLGLQSEQVTVNTGRQAWLSLQFGDKRP